MVDDAPQLDGTLPSMLVRGFTGDNRTAKRSAPSSYSRFVDSHDQYCDALMYPNNKSRRARIPTSLLFRTTGTRVR